MIIGKHRGVFRKGAAHACRWICIDKQSRCFSYDYGINNRIVARISKARCIFIAPLQRALMKPLNQRKSPLQRIASVPCARL
jgi:hypothetical protein